MFIILQLVILVDFAHSWSESWIGSYQETESRFWAVALVSSSIVLYLLSITGTALMYIFYTVHSPSCWINSMFISINVVCCFFFTCLSVHPKVQEKNPRSGLLQSGVVTAFCTYLVYSSLVSEPTAMACTTLIVHPQSPESVIIIILGVAFTFIAIIYSALSTSTKKVTNETTSLVKSDDVQGNLNIEKGTTTTKTIDDEEDVPVPYNYTFFHITFCLAAMYLGMVLTNWAVVVDTQSKVSIDQGMAAVWVKIVSSWITMVLYVWTIVAPLFFPDRVFT